MEFSIECFTSNLSYSASVGEQISTDSHGPENKNTLLGEFGAWHTYWDSRFSQNCIYNTVPMFKNYFITSWRFLLKNKSFTAINIGGLALGMCIAILIGLWIWDEVSFNTYHKNYNRIARVMQNQEFTGEIRTWVSQAKQLGPVLKEDYRLSIKTR